MNGSIAKEVIKIAEIFRKHFDRSCDALCYKQSNTKAKRINGIFQVIKTILEDTGRFNTSELPFFSSAEVWIFVPNIRDSIDFLQ